MKPSEKRKTLLLAAIFISTFSQNAISADEKPQAPIRPENAVIKIFNGKNLDGCYTWLKSTKLEDPKHIFSVSDGILNISGDGLGALITNNEYRDYHTILEFKWGDSNGENVLGTHASRKPATRACSFIALAPMALTTASG